MDKLIKITFCIALAFLVVGCESSETKSSSDSTQTQQVEQQQVATQTKQNSSVEQKYRKLATEALEFVQNEPFEKYQNATFKQMLEKWTNFCASVSWDITRVTAFDSSAYKELFGIDDVNSFMVTAYCEIKDFEATKTYLQNYYTQKGYVDFSFKHIFDDDNDDEYLTNTRLLDFINVNNELEPLLPGGTNIITQKMNKNQKRKVFDYVNDRIYMPLSQAINNSTKIYLAYPFLVRVLCKDNECFPQLGGGSFVSSYWESYLFKRTFSLGGFNLAFEVNGNKLLVNDGGAEVKDKLDMQELMFFNKSIDTISLLEDKFILDKNVEMYNSRFDEYTIKRAGRMLASPAFKKIFYNKQEKEQFFKDFAAEIVKIYSESN